MQADYIEPEVLGHVLAALTLPNETAMRVSMATGLRIDDVLSLKTAEIMRTKNNRITVTESKTRKHKRVYIPQELLDDMRSISGKIYVFEGRNDPTKHRTRQAVYRDLKRAAEAFRVKKSLNISPHTARKVYAVEAFKKYGDPKKVQELLNHNSSAVTALYILAAEVSAKKLHGAPSRRRS